jgi:hypothetical protein
MKRLIKLNRDYKDPATINNTDRQTTPCNLDHQIYLECIAQLYQTVQ